MFARLLRSAGLVRLALASSHARERAKAARLQGDILRDQGEWKSAAGQYRTYLGVHPNNAGIWIQLGHTLKESLQYDAAERAYKRALLLSPNDADGYLQLGHLRRRQGRMHEAAGSYLQAAKIDPLSYASIELRKSEIQACLGVEIPKSSGSDGVTDIVQKIEARCAGVSVTAAHGVVALDGSGHLRLETSDPWIELALHHDSGACFGHLHFEIKWLGNVDGHVPDNRFYIDYGDGYSEEFALDVVRENGWAKDLLIAGPATIRAVRWDPDSAPNEMRLEGLRYRPVESLDEVRGWIEGADTANEGDIEPLDIDGFAAQPAITGKDAAAVQYRLPTSFDRAVSYRYWWERYIKPTEADYRRMATLAADFAIKPKFSFVMPVYNPPAEFLGECIEAMLAQNYADFEICIADDCSPNPEVAEMLRGYEREHGNRVKVCYRQRNGHISAASNSALELASGDYVVLVDHDDLIPDYALWVIAYYINVYPGAQVLFSDEDKVSTSGHFFAPYFKSEYNSFLMYGHNMVSHIGVYATELMRAIGGFRLGYEGSQDYDLFLRCYERIRRDQVVHMPHVLYHWRAIPGSTAVSADQKGYAIYAAQAAINGYFERNAIPMRSVDGFAPGCTAVKATVSLDTPVSIIIPTRDGLDVLVPCIESVLATKPVNCQIIIVDNGSTDPETLAFLEQVQASHGIDVVPYPFEFNFSEINNFAAKYATGDILCFLNNDTEVLSRNWLDHARALLALSGVGMVGARLLFPDRSLQHFGIVLGGGAHGVAGTPHAGIHADEPGYFGKSRLIQEFSAVTAACMFIKKTDFEALGGFDPQFRVAYNDVDLCLRLRAERGLRILCDPDIELIHKESRTRGEDKEGARAHRLEQEAATMRARWGDALSSDPCYSPNLSLERMDFALAYPPRVPMPWRTASE